MRQPTEEELFARLWRHYVVDLVAPDYTDWTRQHLESPGEPSVSDTDPKRRNLAETETKKDLTKPIQQLICDVHEGAFDKNTDPHKLLHATRRMVSMLGRVALEHERTSRLLVLWTVVLVLMTAALIALTMGLLYIELTK